MTILRMIQILKKNIKINVNSGFNVVMIFNRQEQKYNCFIRFVNDLQYIKYLTIYLTNLIDIIKSNKNDEDIKKYFNESIKKKINDEIVSKNTVDEIKPKTLTETKYVKTTGPIC